MIHWMLDAVMQGRLIARVKLVALTAPDSRVGSTQYPSPVEAHHVVVARKGIISKGRTAAGSCMYLWFNMYILFKLQKRVACI